MYSAPPSFATTPALLTPQTSTSTSLNSSPNNSPRTSGVFVKPKRWVQDDFPLIHSVSLFGTPIFILLVSYMSHL